jgi:hypothetical protein
MNKRHLLPGYGAYIIPTVSVIKRFADGATIRQIEAGVMAELNLTAQQVEFPRPNPKESRSEFQYRLAWVRTNLKRSGIVTNISRGVWILTSRGAAMSDLEIRNSVGGANSDVIDVDDVPSIAAPLAGMDWNHEAETGLLAPAPPVVPLSPREEEELRSLLPLLIDAARDLVEILRQSRSNSAQRIAPIAEKYLSAVSKQAGAFSIDGMFAAGVRLRNAQHRLALEVEEEGFPTLSVEIGEAFDSTLGLHGPCLLSTERGNELVRRAREDARSRADELTFKAQAEDFAIQLRRARNLVTLSGKELVEQVVAEIGTGPQPERSTAIAEATTQSLLVRIAKIAISETAKEALKASVIGAGGIAIATGMLNSSVQFLVSNVEQLKLLAAATGESLAWLPHFLNWIEAKSRR